MTEMECLSLMELLDLRAGADDADAREHLAGCPRCRAVLESLPAELALPELPAATVAVPPRPSREAPEQIRTGQLWRARASAVGDWSWVVAVIGSAADAEHRVLVVPAVPEPGLATERDLILDAEPLGYAGFLDLQNLGTLLRSQLVDCLGALPDTQTQGLVALYRWVLGAGAEPKGLPTGAAVVTQNDPRLLAAEERGQELRRLWRGADAQVTDLPDEQEDESASEDRLAAGSPRRAPQEMGLGDVLVPRLEGPDAEWDRAGLLERVGVDGVRFDSFVRGRLDLTDKADVHDLARVLHVLEVPWKEAERAVTLSLGASPGGRREASGPVVPMAARSRPGASEDEITQDLYADQSEVDRSAQARSAEIATYLAELRRALDELE
jgi:hypothetical protein